MWGQKKPVKACAKPYWYKNKQNPSTKAHGKKNKINKNNVIYLYIGKGEMIAREADELVSKAVCICISTHRGTDACTHIVTVASL